MAQFLESNDGVAKPLKSTDEETQYMQEIRKSMVWMNEVSKAAEVIATRLVVEKGLTVDDIIRQSPQTASGRGELATHSTAISANTEPLAASQPTSKPHETATTEQQSTNGSCKLTPAECKLTPAEWNEISVALRSPESLMTGSALHGTGDNLLYQVKIVLAQY